MANLEWVSELAEKELCLDALTQAFRQQLESRLDACIENFEEPEDPDAEWTSHFSVKKLETELGVNCPESLKLIYGAFNDGILDEVVLDVSQQLMHWTCKYPFHFYRHDYNRANGEAVYQASTQQERWCFASFRGPHSDPFFISVDAAGRVFSGLDGEEQIAKSLDELFEVDLSQISGKKLKLFAKNRALSIEEIVGSNRLSMGDIDMVSGPKEYKQFIEKVILSISDGELRLGAFDAGFKDDDLYWLKITLNEREYAFTLDGCRARVDLEIIAEFNKILTDLNGTDERYLVVRHRDWGGDEFGVVFAKPDKLKQLIEMHDAFRHQFDLPDMKKGVEKTKEEQEEEQDNHST